MLAFPCAAGLFVLAWPLLNLLFSEDVDFAAPLLQTLAFAFLFVSLVSVTNSLLQAAGEEAYLMGEIVSSEEGVLLC